MLQTVYSQAAFAQFMHSEASKSFSIDLTNASLVECLTAYSEFLPERVKPYSFVKQYGEVMIRKD